MFDLALGLRPARGEPSSIASFSVEEERATIPIGGALPDFTLVDEAGQPVTRASLAGHVVVFGCAFFHDAMHAPAGLADVRSLADALRRRGSRAQIVTVAIDPQEDSADHLPAAASALGVTAPWSLVTGVEAEVTTLLDALDVDWKRLRAERAKYGTPIFAEDRIFLVDGKGRLRGDYEVTSWTAMRRLRAEIDRVATSE